ncbi:MAG TPA: DUF1702 family protein [Thermoanaerobaculia bacterium]|nr:DUF1702 family protein [Thermoanaerobaculia bacterium]
MPRFLRRFLRWAPDEATLVRRGFADPGPLLLERFKTIAQAFLFGYHATLEDDRIEPLAERLEAFPAEPRGFAYEGAGMALALLDALSLGRRDRLVEFLAGPGSPHLYIVQIGAGWVPARLPLDSEKLRARLDPLSGWLACEGWGFHDGFFHPRRSVARQAVPAMRLSGYGRRAYTQGVGRSLWFICGADPALLAAAIAKFPESRRNDLWSGLGLATAYAGGQDEAALAELRRLAGPAAPALAQGAAFAAEARTRPGNPSAHTEVACRTITGRSVEELARLVAETRPGSADGTPEAPAFEVWRRRLQKRLADVAIAR